MSGTEVAQLFQAAQAAHQAGRADEAFGLIERVLTVDPENPRALNTLGNRALQSGDAAGALALFERAVAREAGQPALWLNLAGAHRALGDDEAALGAIDKALALDPYMLVALLQKGQLLEKRGGAKAAADPYAALLASAPPVDRLPPPIRAALAHAAAVVDENNRRLAEHLDAVLAPVRAKHGPQPRFDEALAIRLGRKQVQEARRPTGLHIPGLRAPAFYDRAEHAWTRELEASTPDILAELRALLADGGGGFRPYIAYAPGTPVNQWGELNHSRRWSTYFLWNEGERIDAHCAACPRTAALIERLPLIDVPGRAPTAFFSLLAPRTRIPPHTGVTNARLIVHLPLIVPDGCGFRVADETREWRVGEAFMFDDTLEHEAWNDSDSPRAVLIVDTWNVDLTEAERDLVRAALQGLDSYYGTFSPLIERP
jgi:aspartate beta-hydroxylase